MFKPWRVPIECDIDYHVLLPAHRLAAPHLHQDVSRRDPVARPRALREEQDRTMAVTLSIGVATAPENGESFEALFTAADRALYRMKHDGVSSVRNLTRIAACL